MVITLASIGILVTLIFIIFAIALLLQKYDSQNANNLDEVDENAVIPLKKHSIERIDQARVEETMLCMLGQNVS